MERQIGGSPQRSAPVAERNSVRFLTIYDGRLYVLDGRDGDLDGAALTSGEAFRRETGFDAPGVNLIENAGFGDPPKAWRASAADLDSLVLESRAIASSSGRAGKALAIAAATPMTTFKKCFISYADSQWGNKIPVFPERRYKLSAQVGAGAAVVSFKIAFLDAHGETLADVETNRASPNAPSSRGGWVKVFIDTPSPAGAVAARISLRLADCAPLAEPSVIASIAEPFFGRSTIDETSSRLSERDVWRPRPEPFECWRDVFREPAPAIHSASLGDPPYGSAFDIIRKEGDSLTVSAPAAATSASIVDFDLSARRLSIAAAGDLNEIALFVDGAPYDYRAPSKARSHTIHFNLCTDLFDDAHHEFAISDFFATSFFAAARLHCPAPNFAAQAVSEDAPPSPDNKSFESNPRTALARVRENDLAAARHSAANGHAWLRDNFEKLAAVINAGPEANEDFFPLAFPACEAPDISVIVPAHNKYAYTFHCLCALLAAPNETAYEVIVVDDGSTDMTATLLPDHTGVTTVRHNEAGGFINACHAGAAAAKGAHLLFLNNDTEPTPGWIDELRAVFDNFQDVGAAGAKLIFPEGRLQDAGGIVWRSGDPFNYGRQKNPFDPRYNYAREVDYLSGAALMTPARVWAEIGGFNRDLAPAYFEDTWYAFELRERGLRAIYAPQAEVIHTQGASYGKAESENTGLRRYQDVNRPKFKRQWAHKYRKHGPSDRYGDSEKDRYCYAQLLLIASDPDALDDRALAFIRAASWLRAKVIFAPTKLRAEAQVRHKLQRIGVEFALAPFCPSLDAALDARADQIDAVFFADTPAAIETAGRVRAITTTARTLLLPVDADGFFSDRDPMNALYPSERSVISKLDFVLQPEENDIRLDVAEPQLLTWTAGRQRQTISLTDDIVASTRDVLEAAGIYLP